MQIGRIIMKRIEATAKSYLSSSSKDLQIIRIKNLNLILFKKIFIAL